MLLGEQTEHDIKFCHHEHFVPERERALLLQYFQVRDLPKTLYNTIPVGEEYTHILSEYIDIHFHGDTRVHLKSTRSQPGKATAS